MAQNFLLSATARTLSLKAIYSRGEDAAYQRFCHLRWPETVNRPAKLTPYRRAVLTPLVRP